MGDIRFGSIQWFGFSLVSLKLEIKKKKIQDAEV
jgi:hypothetical protein